MQKLVGKTQEKRAPTRPRSRWYDNIKTDTEEIKFDSGIV
jgi:hypothetical protein